MSRSVVLFFLIILAACSKAQSAMTLRGLLEQTLSASGTQKTLSAEAIAQVLDTVPGLPTSSLQDAVPLLGEALRRQDSDTRRIAIITIYCIDQRPDSALINAPLVAPLIALLDDPDPELVALAVRSVAVMKPQPPLTIVTPLVDYLNRTRPVNRASAAIAYALVRVAPQQESVAAAIQSCLTAAGTVAETRVAIINSLISTQISSVGLINQLMVEVDALQDESVRIAAINALSHTGDLAWGVSHDRIARIAKDDKEDASVRNAAMDVLRSK